jgi:uncharacterized protein with HEPN domain
LTDEAGVLDMLQAARRIAEYTSSIDEATFFSDWRAQSIVLHQTMILGEAAKRISEDFRAEHPDIPWRRIAGMRDVLIHGYDEVRLPDVWSAATNDVPALVPALERTAPQEEQ